MIKRERFSPLLMVFVLAISSCTRHLPTDTSMSKENKSFTTEALTVSYELRKLNMLLGINPPGPADGPGLLKELVYAQAKGNAAVPVADVILANPPLYNLIKTNPDVAQRFAMGGSFAQFLDSLDPVKPVREFKVNSIPGGFSQNQSVSLSDNGKFIVAWEGVNSEISARLYNSAGQPVGAEFQVNTYIDGQQSLPSTAIDSNGNFIIAWESFQSSNGSMDIYAKRYDSNGVAIAPEFRVNTVTADDQRTASVAMNDSGNFVISWDSMAEDGSSFGVFARTYGSDGQPLGSPFQANSYTSGPQFRNSVAINNSGNIIYFLE
jgi:uncharacterized protein YejL (UPF0352 family)